VVSGGVATFSTLTINNTGGYTLTATDDVLIPATSNPFSVTLIDVLTASTANAITLTQDPDGQHIDWIQGSSIGVIPINDPNGLTINGDAGNDSITLDYTNGNPFPNTLHLNGTFTIAGLQGANPLANTALGNRPEHGLLQLREWNESRVGDPSRLGRRIQRRRMEWLGCGFDRVRSPPPLRRVGRRIRSGWASPTRQMASLPDKLQTQSKFDTP